MSTKKEWTAGELLALSGAYWETCTLHAAVKLDLFTRIGERRVGAEALAAELGSDLRGTRMLLDALSAMGLLVKDSAGYRNTDEALTLLSKDSDQYIGHIILHHHHLVEAWGRLDRAVCTGRPVEKKNSTQEEQREHFLMGMFNLAMAIAPRLAREIDLSGKRRLLDLGGGPGTYAIHFCKANPELRAGVLDLPTTRPFALRTIERFGMSNRVDFIPCDYVEDELHGSFDAAWLSHILHGEGPDTCREILRKTAGVLEPGGLVLIHEFILNDTEDAPLFPALFSLNMLVNTPRGRAYTEGELKSMLEEAGFRDVGRLPFNGPNESGILRAVLPAA